MAWLIISIVAIFVVIFALFATFSQQPKHQAPVKGIDWNAIQDEALQSYLPDRKINAIKRYRELTGQGLKEAKEAIEYVIANPDAKKSKSSLSANTGGAGVRDLLLEGQFEEAVDVYAAFMGVDEFTARDAVQQIQRELDAENRLADVDTYNLRELVANGRKIEAIRHYMDTTGAPLKDAKQFIETEL